MFQVGKTKPEEPIVFGGFFMLNRTIASKCNKITLTMKTAK
jgi:hypothetical protein